MAERKRIGLFFTYDENWIGGSYYIMNLIESLKKLPEASQPHITVFCNTQIEIDKIKQIAYPFIDFDGITINKAIIARTVKFVVKKLFRYNLPYSSPLKKYPNNYFDLLFPFSIGFVKNISKKNIFWIPDFQEDYLPDFFSKQEIANRKKMGTAMAFANNSQIVFSSVDAKNDFKRLYPKSKATLYVMSFVVHHPNYAQLSFATLQAQYQLPDQYFFCPNQFWVHKNQKVIIEAMVILKKQYHKNINIVFSGKNYEFRFPQYYPSILQLIEDNNLQHNVSMLGFIDRLHQLCIMKNAIAVIQPSLFEGWSTVVEDCKAMNQSIIASHLPVHKEQLQDAATYFNPNDAQSLAAILNNYIPQKLSIDYNQHQIDFANTFINIINN